MVRAQLDGSNPEVLWSKLDNPNGVVATPTQIYVVDSHAKRRDRDNWGLNGGLYETDRESRNWASITGPGLQVFWTSNIY